MSLFTSLYRFRHIFPKKITFYMLTILSLMKEKWQCNILILEWNPVSISHCSKIAVYIKKYHIGLSNEPSQSERRISRWHICETGEWSFRWQQTSGWSHMVARNVDCKVKAPMVMCCLLLYLQVYRVPETATVLLG